MKTKIDCFLGGRGLLPPQERWRAMPPIFPDGFPGGRTPFRPRQIGRIRFLSFGTIQRSTILRVPEIRRVLPSLQHTSVCCVGCFREGSVAFGGSLRDGGLQMALRAQKITQMWEPGSTFSRRFPAAGLPSTTNVCGAWAVFCSTICDLLGDPFMCHSFMFLFGALNLGP